MLLIIIAVAALIFRHKIRLEVILVLLLLYCLHYTFMGRLADLMNGFVNPFLISSIAILTIEFLFRLKQKNVTVFFALSGYCFFLYYDDTVSLSRNCREP